MPDLISLTAIQLQVLNKELSEPFSILNTKIDEWIRFCKTNDNLTVLDKFFIKNMFEHFEIMQEVIDNNQIVKDIRTYNDFQKSENHIYFGVYPTEGLWEIYEQTELVSPETITYLKKRTKNNKLYSKYIPMMNIVPDTIESSETIITDLIEENGNIEVSRTRKFISLD